MEIKCTASRIRIKRSAVAGKKPVVTDLNLGELLLNTHDAELYTLRDRFAASGIATDVVRLGAGATVSNVIYVTKDGNDENSGKNLETQKRQSKEQSQSPQQDLLLELVLDLI